MAQGTTPNSREPISAQDMLTHESFYVEGTESNGAINVNANVVFPGLIDVQYDYISVAYPDDHTEVYTFKTGGSGGTTVATVTVVYTSSTKADLSSVTRV